MRIKLAIESLEKQKNKSDKIEIFWNRNKLDEACQQNCFFFKDESRIFKKKTIIDRIDNKLFNN